MTAACVHRGDSGVSQLSHFSELAIVPRRMQQSISPSFVRCISSGLVLEAVLARGGLDGTLDVCS